MRAFYITNRMNSLLLPNRTLLDPVHYGYEEIDEMVLPDTGKYQIPEEFAVVCNCIKCSSKRCKCRASCLACCEFCKCQSEIEAGNCCKNSYNTQISLFQDI